MNILSSRNITVRRDKIAEDVTHYFGDDSIASHHVVVSVEGERAVDENGVFRDVTTAYWSDVFDSTAFNGDSQASPAPHPSHGPRFWKAMGNFMIAGFRQNGYLPVRFALASLVWAIFGEDLVTEEIAISSWLMILGPRDRDVITSALRSGITEINRTPVICVLDIFRNSVVPTTANLRSVCLRCARFSLIENAMFPLTSMRLNRLRSNIHSVGVLKELYVALRPTADSILDMFVPENMDSPRRFAVYDYLTQSVRNMDDAALRLFTRFVSGSDAITFDRIRVQFVYMDGLGRRIISHTCGVVIDVPSTYTSYNEFQREFMSQLHSGQWDMDFA